MLKKYIIICILILLMVSISNADVPPLINYQGWFTDRDGNPLNAPAVAPVSIQFKIYDSENNGNILWSETQSVTVAEGIFSVLLGSVTPIPYSVFDGTDRYFTLQVESDSEMLPRKRLVSVGYSFRARNSDKLDGKHDSSFVQSVTGVSPDNNGNIDLVAGSNVTITPDDLNNQITISATPGGGGDHLGNHTATQNIELNGNWLSGDGDSEGVFVKSDGQVGIGTKDSSAQLYVLADSPLAVVGTASGDNSIGVTGKGFIGVWGVGSNLGVAGYSPNKYAVYGYSDLGRAVAGYNGVNLAEGYLGMSDVGAGGYYILSTNYGLLGTENWGVYGKGGVGPNAVSSVTNYQRSNANASYGVYGEHGNGNYGYIGGDTYSVYGQNGDYSGYLGGYSYGVCGRRGGKAGYLGGINYAGYFDGDVHVTGIFTASGHKSFKIDHPLDPENKYLYHYCMESDELTNVYSGNVKLDANGEGVVELPEWFEALNKDFRYQLTCIGGFAQVYIADKISNNSFKIAGGKPGMEISWLVTGIRNDAYAKTHPVQVEVEKEGRERGKYMHPSEHGMPETLGINYEERKRNEEQDRNVDEERQRIAEKILTMEEENRKFREDHKQKTEEMR